MRGGGVFFRVPKIGALVYFNSQRVEPPLRRRFVRWIGPWGHRTWDLDQLDPRAPSRWSTLPMGELATSLVHIAANSAPPLLSQGA